MFSRKKRTEDMDMKNIKAIAMAVILSSVMLVSCGDSSSSQSGASSQSAQQSSSQQEEKRVAKDGAQMQTQDKNMPTRVPMECGTKINIHFGDTVIPGVLNDSPTAKALIEKLPMTQKVSRYSHDFCGVTQELPYDKDSVHYGWLNGDIDYAINAPYFTILFEDEESSEKYGDQVNIGVITCELEKIKALEGEYELTIELA